MDARGLALAVLLGVAACGRTSSLDGPDAGAGGWLLEVKVAWDAALVPQTVEVRWGAGPTRRDSEVSASLQVSFASASQARAFAATVEVLVGGRRVASELVTGDACAGVGALGLEPDDYPVATLSRRVAADGQSVQAGPTVCQRHQGPTGLTIDPGQRTLSYLVRGLASPVAATFAGTPVLPRSVTFASGAADVELVLQSPHDRPASALRGPLQVSVGGEAAGAVPASFDACLAVPGASPDVSLQVQDLLVSGGALSLGSDLLCCFPQGCRGISR
jgi:hypothetical protein